MPGGPATPPLVVDTARPRVRRPRHRWAVVAVAALLIVLGACSDDGGSSSSPTSTSPTTADDSPSPTSTAPASTGQEASRRFTAEVWADNWFSLHIDGELVGEDSVPITTERSFNGETIEFEASYPFTIALVAKDYKADDSGLEYIGSDRQQMGDGGLIAQITDTSTGKVVAVTGADWRGLVIHRAPLDTGCERSPDPATECTAQIDAEPAGWMTAEFDDGGWVDATVYTDAEVRPQGDYTAIPWDPAAELIWTSSLEQDNTILWRRTVEAP